MATPFYLNKLIPRNVVTSFLSEKLVKDTVFAGLTTSYVPGTTVQRGASYVIPSLSGVNVSQYDGTDLTMQNVTDSGVALTITQADSFDFAIDNVDASLQSKQLMQLYINEAAVSMTQTQDAWTAGMLTSGAGLDNTDVAGTSAASVAISIDESTIGDYMRELKATLDKNNVSQVGRFVVLPADALGYLAQSSVETASTTDEFARLFGYVQKYFGMNIYMSNNLVVDTGVYDVLAGVATASTMIQTLQNVEFFKPDARFAEAAKGLNVYGGVVNVPNSLIASKVSF